MKQRFIKNSDFYDNKNLAGYAGRRHILILKLSMIVSASERDTRIVDEADVRVALNILTSAEETMPNVLAQISSEPIGDVCEEILHIIKYRKTISRKELLKSMKHKLVARDLDVILDSLAEMGVVNSGIVGKDINYIYVGN